jgi:predicted GNAT family N-acyltransferase
MMIAPYLGIEWPDRQPPMDFEFKIARSERERAAFWRLRRKIFCDEQRLFAGSDRDIDDASMIPIVSQALLLGAPDEVIGCVRIFEKEPGIWWGGRLGVARAYRHLDAVSPATVQRAGIPERYTGRSIGGALIYKAVSSARRLGCRAFYAHVQLPNVSLFERLGWQQIGHECLHGLGHATMRADLEQYPTRRSSHESEGLSS